MPAKSARLRVDGHAIELTNLDKILYPAGHLRKGEVIDYYIRISEYLLPHLKNRPVTLKRFPDGVFGEFFYEKNAPAFTPEWVKTFPVPRRESNGPDIRYIVIDRLATLVWLANLATLEIHPFLHKVPTIDRPTSIVFDCDPGEGADVLTCARVAAILREVLADLGLDCYPKVSGSKGVQVYVPLNSPVSYDVSQPFAKGIAELLAEREPKLVVAQMTKALRKRKVFIDWSQNSDFKTTVGVYSLRAKSHKPHVSLPVEWDELKAAVRKDDPELLYFTPNEALSRMEKGKDLFAPLLTQIQKLPDDVVGHVGSRGRLRNSSDAIAKPRPKGIGPSKQGSRRRFDFRRRRRTEYELRLEMENTVRVWRLRGPIPLKKNDSATARVLEEQPIGVLENAAGHETAGSDYGIYELIEGSYKSGRFEVFLNGQKFRGELMLSREGHDTWRIGKTDFAATTATIKKARKRTRRSRSRAETRK
jgi:bifunctional non-homologous end joining protein LigD